MIRFIFVMLLLVLGAIAADWLAQHPGMIEMVWLGYEIRLSVAVALVAASVLVIGLSALLMVLWRLATWPERRRARKHYRTLSSGLKQLTIGVTALAMGDEKSAEIALKKASAALPSEPLPMLLTAQLLQRQGQSDLARKELTQLLQHEVTALLASRRLIEQHMQAKQWNEALALAEALRAQHANDRWLALTLIDLYVRLGDSAKVLSLSEGWKWQSPLSREERHHFAAIGYLLKSKAEASEQATLNALRHAIGFAPDFLPALSAYAEQLIEAGQPSRARKILREFWIKHPHRSLIPLILESLRGEPERAQKRLLKAFTSVEMVSASVLEARYHLSIKDLEGARVLAEKACSHEHSKETALLMADSLKALGKSDEAAEYLTRAATAPEGERWLCRACGTAHEAWATHCSQCQTFDTIELRASRAGETISSVIEITA